MRRVSRDGEPLWTQLDWHDTGAGTAYSIAGTLASLLLLICGRHPHSHASASGPAAAAAPPFR